MDRIFTRAMLVFFRASAAAAVAALAGFGVVLSFFWLGNGGKLSPEMGGGFELFYSGLAGVAAGMVGFCVGGILADARLPREPNDDPPAP